uniref:ANK2 n=1 Tax=Poeciliopsis prolifica TaxID=188132 RepID=A0A0S7EXY9_9TELE
MSVKELMQAFQTGQDPSKRKSGLFEVKTAATRSEKATPSQSVQSKSMMKAMTSHASQGQEVLLDPKNAKKQTTLQEKYIEIKFSTHSEPSETLDFGNGGIDNSSENCKHEGVVKSLSGSYGDHLNSEDSYKHEGLTSSGRTPESLYGLQSTTTLSTTSTKVKDLTDKDKSGDSGDQVSTELTLRVSSSEAADDHTTSESMSLTRAESKPTRPQNLIKRVSETVETFLSDDNSPDDQITLPLIGSPVSRSPCKYDESFDLPLKQELDALSPLADDSLTISHRDSLEGSPLIEENSSHKSPDSIEPSPTTESSPCDSLESSPVQQKSHSSFPPVHNAKSPSTYTSHSKAKDLPQDAFHGRLLGDPENTADDDSCEQTSQMTSSGKSLLSPDTPSSEEVSYEVNPRLLDNAFLCISFKPAAIPEDPAEDDATYNYEAKKEITPEEEMFKMAAKIKTFNQMEQDPKSNRRFSKDLFFSGNDKTGDNSCETLKPSTEKFLQIECRLNRHTEDSKLANFIGPDIKVQPPSPFSAGVHDGTQSKEVKNTSATVTSEGSHSVSDQHHSKSNLKTSWDEVPSFTEAVNHVCNTTSATSSVENRTDEQKQESLKRSSDNVDNTGHMLDVSKVQTGMQKPNCNVTDEVKEDRWGHAGAPKAELCPGVATSQTKYEVFIYNDGEEENETSNLPRTESKGVTARVETEPWSAMREDDVTFAARVKDEEQKILNLVMDRQSVQATPDTTPGRTPTEESSPTSEPNPFLFQEGKLFEMTRSGAIDMTKRSYEEEGGGFAFFQIGITKNSDIKAILMHTRVFSVTPSANKQKYQ